MATSEKKQADLKPQNNILWFFGKSLFLYLAMVFGGIWLNLYELNGDWFRNVNNHRFKNNIEQTRVNFTALHQGSFDTKIHIRYANAQQWTTVDYLLDSWYITYIPTAIFLALALAFNYGNYFYKLLYIIIGLVFTGLCIYLILYCRVYIMKIQAQQILDDYENTLFDRMMLFMHNNVVVYAWLPFVLPMFIWFMLSIKRLQFDFANKTK